MRLPEPPDWMNLFISVLRALFFQHEWPPKPLMLRNRAKRKYGTVAQEIQFSGFYRTAIIQFRTIPRPTTEVDTHERADDSAILTTGRSASQARGRQLQMAIWSQMASWPENIPPKGVGFSDLICTFAIPVVGFFFFATNEQKER